MINFLKNIINRGTILQKIFLILLTLNSTIILFYFFTQEFSGDHYKNKLCLKWDYIYCVEKKWDRSDIMIGVGEKTKYGIGRRRIYNLDYTNFGLSYQEFFLWGFVEGFLFFCMYVFKSRKE